MLVFVFGILCFVLCSLGRLKDLEFGLWLRFLLGEATVISSFRLKTNVPALYVCHLSFIVTFDHDPIER